MEQLLNDFHQPSVMNLQGRDFNEALVGSSNGQMYVENSQKEHRGRQWSPYEVNGGTVAAIAVKDSIIMASDSRYNY